MTHGRSDVEVFKLKINRRDISELSNRVYTYIDNTPELINLLNSGAPLNDFNLAKTLFVLQEFFVNRRLEVPFELVLNE